MNVYQKLIEVRKSVPYLQKENSGSQYKYVSSSQTLSSLREKLDEHNLLLIPEVISTNVLTETVEKADGKKTTTYFTELTMQFTWVNAEKPDEKIVCPWYGQGVDIAGEKGVGKALTYAEKYFMLKFFNIATDKDDPDSFQSKGDAPPPKPAQGKPPITATGVTEKAKPETLKTLLSLISDRAAFDEYIKKTYQATAPVELTEIQAQSIINQKKGATK